MDCVNRFRGVLQAHYGPLDWLPIADGSIHRFRVLGDKPGSLNGAYQIFPDGIAWAWFGTWKDGGNWHTWSSRKPADHLEAQLIAQRIEQARRQREAEQHQRQQAAAQNANRLWNLAQPVDEHPYLARKQVRAYGLRRYGGLLLVPLTLSGLLVNLQRIYPDGSKRFLRGGMVKGCCSLIGTAQPGQLLYICEGWATGATLHAATGAAVACAMNAGNLLEVGQRVQRQQPEAVLIVAGDDDRMTEGNPGRTAAIKAAATLGCGLIFPPWCGSEPLTLSDFNDLANWRADQ